MDQQLSTTILKYTPPNAQSVIFHMFCDFPHLFTMGLALGVSR